MASHYTSVPSCISLSSLSSAFPGYRRCDWDREAKDSSDVKILLPLTVCFKLKEGTSEEKTITFKTWVCGSCAEAFNGPLAASS